MCRRRPRTRAGEESSTWIAEGCLVRDEEAEEGAPIGRAAGGGRRVCTTQVSLNNRVGSRKAKRVGMAGQLGPSDALSFTFLHWASKPDKGTAQVSSIPSSSENQRPSRPGLTAASFLFLCFSKKKLQKYILGFRFYSSIPLPPGRGAVGTYM